MESVIHFLSPLIAISAAGIAVYAALQTKRNADKAVGDLDPFIHVFQDLLTGLDGDIPILVVQVVNHNRRPMHLSLRFTYHDGFRVFPVTKDATRAIADVIFAESEEREITYRTMIAGNYTLGAPDVDELRFKVFRNEDTPPSETTVGVDITYRLDDGEELSLHRNQVITRRRDAGGNDFTVLRKVEADE